MKKVKICFISLGSYPLFNPQVAKTFGGAEVQMYLMAQEISKRKNFEVSFIVGDYSQKNVEKYGNIKLFKLGGNSIFKNNLRIIPIKIIRFIKLIKSISADVYIQRSASSGTGFIRLITKFLGKRFVYMTAHDIDCNGEFEKSNNLITAFLFRYGIRNADLVITQSKKHANMLKKHHGIESVIFRSSYEIPQKQIEIKNKDGVLWVARCENWKQPDVFLKIVSKLPKVKFTMICPRSKNQPEYFDKVKKIASKYKNLIFLDYVPYNEIDGYFKRNKIFVNSSVNEGFPNTFVQALKNSTPIVSLNVNPDNFLHKFNCGFCANNRLETMTRKISKLISDTDLYTEYAENAYFYAFKYHNININIRKLIYFIQNPQNI